MIGVKFLNVVLLLLLVVAIATLLSVRELKSELEVIPMEEPASKYYTWEDADCATRQVCTTKGPSETTEQFCARHDAQVAHDVQRYGVKGMESLNGHSFLSWYLQLHPGEKLRTVHWKE